jgi:hypothetical protein
MKNKNANSIALISPIITALIAFLGIWFGNYLALNNSYELFLKQNNYENQIISYSKLSGLESTFIQNANTLYLTKLQINEGMALVKLFETQIQPDHIAYIEKLCDREHILLREKAEILKDILETLGLIQICFNIDEKLQLSIDDFYKMKKFRTPEFPKQKSQAEYKKYYEKQLEIMHKWIDNEYSEKFILLRSLLKTQLDEKKE